MKKLSVILAMIFLLVFAFSAAVMAVPPEKTVSMELLTDNDYVYSEADDTYYFVISQDEELEMTIQTLKQGSNLEEANWSTETASFLDYKDTIKIDGEDETYYETTATFGPADPGEYQIEYSILLSSGNPANNPRAGNVKIWITVLGEEQSEIGAPAAPAVAAHLLRDAGIQPNSKEYKNYIAQVADHMGPETDFDGVGKEDTEAYKDAVKAFLIDIHALPNS